MIQDWVSLVNRPKRQKKTLEVFGAGMRDKGGGVPATITKHFKGHLFSSNKRYHILKILSSES